MTSHAQKALSIADRVVTMAENGLGPLERTIKEWPAEFRAIIWDAVAEIAVRRAEAARRSPAPAELTKE
ncbi:hypothetical protein ACVMIH_000076 [Bradyrhizobium sp. USDA 4503]